MSKGRGTFRFAWGWGTADWIGVPFVIFVVPGKAEERQGQSTQSGIFVSLFCRSDR